MLLNARGGEKVKLKIKIKKNKEREANRQSIPMSIYTDSHCLWRQPLTPLGTTESSKLLL
jgi:hypothetical protein